MTMTTIDTTQDQATATRNPRPAANDDRRPRAAADTTVLSTHPEFVESVRRALIRFGRRKHLEDDIPEVQCRALEAARVRMPPDLARWKGLGQKTAKHYAIDERRKLEARGEYDTGLCEEPDEHGPIENERGRDPVDAKRYLGVLKDCFDRGEMPGMGGEILWGTAEEIAQEEIAEEAGLSERQVKKRLKAMRVRFSQRLDEMGLRDGVSTRCDKSRSQCGT
ncbi:MAG TPA: hypothetical protein VIF09_18225 [Polyangiaceae bacterium]